MMLVGEGIKKTDQLDLHARKKKQKEDSNWRCDQEEREQSDRYRSSGHLRVMKEYQRLVKERRVFGCDMHSQWGWHCH